MQGPQQNLGPEHLLGTDPLSDAAVSSVAPRPQTLMSLGPLQPSPQAQSYAREARRLQHEGREGSAGTLGRICPPQGQTAAWWGVL